MPFNYKTNKWVEPLPTRWKQKDGELLKIKEMGTDHLIASAHYLRRRAASIIKKIGMKDAEGTILSYQTYLKAFSKELRSRPDGVTYVKAHPSVFGKFMVFLPNVAWEINSIRSKNEDDRNRGIRVHSGHVRILTGRESVAGTCASSTGSGSSSDSVWDS